MSKENVSWDTIGDLDGGMAGAIINAEINKAVADLEDRGEDAKPRHVIIDLILTVDAKTKKPVVEVAAQAKMPPRRSGGTVAEQRHTPHGQFLMFQSHNPENPDQNTFPAMDKDKEEESGDKE